ncbi:hypothetical protein F5Y15DRAFT_419856 [Xylariaceae sp. FL0016]|nr:hypothetical protein F5Y15DRAFT_419856 [Xylariaceae sp. FL0016]
MLPRQSPPTDRNGDVEAASAASPFGAAIDQFLTNLGEKEKNTDRNQFIKEIQKHQKLLHAGYDPAQSDISSRELQSFVDKEDSRKRDGKGFRLIHRLSPFLESLRNLMKKCEAFTQVSPFGVSVAFVGARVILEMALAVDEYLEVILTALEQIGGILSIYQKLDSSFPDLQTRLVSSYKKIIEFWYQTTKVFSSSKLKGVTSRSILTPLKRVTDDAVSELRVDMAIILGNAQAQGLVLDQQDRLAKVQADQKDLIDELRRWIMGSEAFDYREDYETQLQLKHEGTCEWIFDDSRFSEWRGSKQNALLWYHAVPTSGKSVLAATVIHELKNQGKNVVYFFYSFNKTLRRQVKSGLRALASQLLALTDRISDKLYSILENERQYGPYLSNTDVLLDVIHELLTRLDLYLVIDGLDECIDEADMLPHLEKLIQRPTLGTARWLFTSRMTDIRKSMGKLKAVEIVPENKLLTADILKYISANIRCEDCSLKWSGQSETNFLYARFVCQTLRKLTSREDIEAELRAFPKDLTHYYERTLERIASRNSNREQELARRIFLILVIAQQSISVDELLDALGICRGSEDYSSRRLPKEEAIVDLCGSLVVFERPTGQPKQDGSPIVRLCHKSVQDFFLQGPETEVKPTLRKFILSPNAAHIELGLDCLDYLMYSRYAKHLDLEFLKSKNPKEHSFLRYAATFWFQHLEAESDTTPSFEVVQAVKKFIGSRNFWTCLQVQSQEVPYLFGRYTSVKKRYKMGIRGNTWKAGDSFGLPLPEWLSRCSADGCSLDQSLCSFADEWREVITSCPSALGLCLPVKPYNPSCHLRCLSRTTRAQVFHLEIPLKAEAICGSRLFGVRFVGKKLCLRMLYQEKVAGSEHIWELRQQLFKANSEHEITAHDLPFNLSDSDWHVSFNAVEEQPGQLIAWSVGRKNLSVRQMTSHHSQTYNPPVTVLGADKRGKEWETVNDFQTSANGVPLLGFYVSNKTTRPNWNFMFRKDETGDKSFDESSSTATEDEFSSEDNQYSEDESESSGTCNESPDEDVTLREPNLEDGPNRCDDMDCIILIPTAGKPFWTQTWETTPSIWARTVCAGHPTFPIVCFMPSPSQLRIIDLEQRTQRAVKISGLDDQHETPQAHLREMSFSPCGKYLRLLSITFDEKEYGTECAVAIASTSSIPDSCNDQISLTDTDVIRCVYSLADHPIDLPSPFVLTSWCDDYVLIALPPLTCEAKILKITLGPGCDDRTILTLREPIYFPNSTPRRDARLLCRPSTKNSEGYIFLVLNAVTATSAENPLESSQTSPVVALRWSVSDDEGWREWDAEVDGKSTELKNGISFWTMMRGTYAESGRPFSVPIRSGLNWTRKGYLSCS